MKRRILAAALVAIPTIAAADLETIASPHPVAETTDKLAAAAEEAGATIVARVDHAAAARGAGMELGEAQLLIFGNPALGTPAMQEDLRAGLMLPLRVLVYAGEGGETLIVWQGVDDLFDDTDVDDGGEAAARIRAALDTLTTAAIR